MARSFKFSLDRRIANRIITLLLRSGMAPKGYYLLTVPGRVTGRPHSVPVALVEHEHARWLVAPYGDVDWVRNAIAAGKVTLSHGRESEILSLRRLSERDAAPVLKEYIAAYPITRPYFDAGKDSPLEAFAKEAESKLVFELIA